MDNIFQIGGKVLGKSFIGRKKEIEYLRKVFLENDDRTGKAIIGLTRTGKSSIATNLFQDLPKDVLYVYEDLNEMGQYTELWQDICYSVDEYLTFHGKMTDSMKTCLKNLDDESIPWIKLNRTVKRIFEELAKMGIKTILVLDEFDNASNLFSEGTKQFELFRTIFSDAKYDVSAMTISRRNLHTIEGSTYQSSTFHGVLDTRPLKGFDDDDMKEYYEVFEKINVPLSEEQKKEIEYYAGRSPFLLSIMGHYIIDSFDSGESIDITSIFLEKCKSINDYYRDIIQHLTRDDDIKRIIPFIIGPNVGVTQNDRDELVSMGYLREEEGELVAISKYFESFMTANMLQISIWDNVINLEKKIKLLIEKEFSNVAVKYQAKGTDTNEIQRCILQSVKGITNNDITRYDKFIESNMKVFNIPSSYLDVMSLTDAFKIVKDCWIDIFSKYFSNELLSNWSPKFDKCSRARNPIAHGHEEYLSELDKNEVDTYCKQIFDKLANNEGVGIVDVANNMVDKIEEKDFVTSELETICDAPTAELIGKEAEFKVVKRGGAKHNNLSGIVEERYKGTIPKNYLYGIDIDALIGAKIRVKILRIDGDHYLLEYSPVDK